MAQSETTKPQYLSSTKLSAEADSFIPGRGVAGDGGDPISPQQFSQLPRYITSCYPFVQGDPGATPSASGGSSSGVAAGSGPGRPQAPNYAGQRMPAPNSGGYNFPGTRPPGPQNFSVRGMRPGMMPRGGPYPGGHVLGGYPGGGPHGPVPMGPGQGGSGYYPPYHHHHYPPYHHGHHHVMHSPGGWGPPGGHYPPPPECQIPPGYGHPPGYMMEQGMEWTGTEWVRSADRKTRKKKDAGHMVSVGVQNEAGSLGGLLPKIKKPKTKTIILMDAAIQTDFSDEFANLTLAEKPNSLYRTRGGRWAEEYEQDHSCTTTDSEEVDSDSGYSSPLHRRNQINNGTHPVGGLYLTPVISHHPGEGLTHHHGGLLGRPSLSGAPGSVPSHYHSPQQQQQLPPHLQHLPQQHHYPASYLSGMPSPGVSVGGGSVVSAGGGTMAFSYSAVASAANSSPYYQFPMASPAGAASPAPPLSESPLTRTGSRSNVASSRGSRASSAGSPHPSSSATKTEPEDEGDGSGATKKKRRRNRRRKKKSGATDDTGALSDEPSEMRHAHSSSNVSRTSGDVGNADPGDDTGLRFEDEEEFPNLLSAASSQGSRKSASQTNLSYSDILKTPASLSQENLLNSSQFHSSNSLGSDRDHDTSGGKESKNARKRRKRREMANRAAEEELAEITLEQQVLRELSHKHHPTSWPSLSAATTGAADEEDDNEEEVPAPVPAPKSPAPITTSAPVSRPKTPPATAKGKVKSNQPISLNIADMIDALEKQREQGTSKDQHRLQGDSKMTGHIVNILDSTAPAKRGKEREVPKPKKPSPLKKVILKEREEKKRMRLLDDEPPYSPGEEDNSAQMLSVPGNPIESDLSQDCNSSKSSSAEAGILTPMSAEMSPISQNSPISMSPLSPGGSPLSSGITSPIASNSMLGERKTQVVMKIHSRRFREYCTQILDKDIDQCCTELLQDLVRFQDRLYHKDPSKAKSKRRIVLGLREVTKHLRLRKIKVVIISPNLERIQSKGGLDEALNNIIQMCTEQEVPFVFALGRRALGRACAKLVPVSVVGVFNYEGSEDNFRSLMDLTENARMAYTEMVQQLEKEQQENPNRHPGSVPPFYAHMGHSRTPSACSAISFTSSILSEPISENYPQSEPETDSRGYEIIREALIRDSDGKGGMADSGAATSAAAAAASAAAAANAAASAAALHREEVIEKITIIESLDDIDEDREETTERITRKPQLRRESDGDDGDDEEEEEDDDSDNDSDDDDSDSNSSRNDDETEYDRDTVRELPHIDSIHSSVVDLSTEILSQHSSKNVDASAEVLSTHSSNKTLGESNMAAATTGTQSAGITSAEPCLSPEKAVSQNGDISDPSVITPAASAGGSSTAHKLRSMDKERIESWVAEAQQHIERLTVHEGPGQPNTNKDGGVSVEGAMANPQNGKILLRASPLKQMEDGSSLNGKQDLSLASVCDGKQQTS